MRNKVILALTLLTSVVATRGADLKRELFAEHFDGPLGSQWKEHVFKGHTEYRVVKEGTNGVLRAHAAGSASGVGVEVKAKAQAGTTLKWRWKIDRVPQGASDTQIDKFDHTARIYIAFKSTLVPRTLNYVWSASGKIGSTFNHPSSGRARCIVLESGNEKAGQWLSESRDIYADWKRLFGDEPPPIESIGLMTDSDGTATDVTGFYDDLELIAK